MSPYDDRLDRLAGIAAHVFAAKGFHQTSMRDLARETGMSLAGMYHYVRGKHELLFLIQERCFRAVLEGARGAIGPDGDATERLGRFIRHHVLFFTEHMPEMKVLSHEAESVAPEHKRHVDALKQEYVDILVGLLDDCAHGADVSDDRRVAAYGLFGMMNWIYTWYDPDGSVTPTDLADQFTTLFLHGIADPAAVHGA
jgi:AcrR family transcriptional regulator